MAFAAQEHEILPAKMCFPPIADDGLPYRVQRFAAGGPARKVQHQPLCIRAAGHLKPDSAEQQTTGAEFQFSFTSQFMDVKPRTLHVTELAFRVMSTRAATAHEPPSFDEI